MVHTFNSNIQEAETDGSLSRGQPGLRNESQDSQGLKQEERRKERKKEERKEMNLG